jgi:hypothetical protein
MVHAKNRERYLAASTYLSSRAFPSAVLESTPWSGDTPSPYPLLLPGVDVFNHRRGWAVSWVTSHRESSSPGAGATYPNVSLILHSPTNKGAELFNNYGAKPNSELILGYGFSTQGNEDDTIVLKIGGNQGIQGMRSVCEVGRDARGAEHIWRDVLRIVRDGEDEDEDAGYEHELDAADLLSQMTRSLLERLLLVDCESLELRVEVKEMLRHYVEGPSWASSF